MWFFLCYNLNMKLYIRKITDIQSFTPDEETTRITGFLSLKKQKESLTGYFLLKDILKEKGYDTFKIIRKENKRPYLDIPLFYSLSHSKDYVICMVETDNIGIDIQYKTDQLLNIRRRTGETSDDIETLTINWALKEAYIKYINDVKIPLKAIKINGENPYRLTYQEEAICHIIKYEDYMIAVCSKADKKVVLVHD